MKQITSPHFIQNFETNDESNLKQKKCLCIHCSQCLYTLPNCTFPTKGLIMTWKWIYKYENIEIYSINASALSYGNILKTQKSVFL